MLWSPVTAERTQRFQVIQMERQWLTREIKSLQFKLSWRRHTHTHIDQHALVRILLYPTDGVVNGHYSCGAASYVCVRTSYVSVTCARARICERDSVVTCDYLCSQNRMSISQRFSEFGVCLFKNIICLGDRDDSDTVSMGFLLI